MPEFVIERNMPGAGSLSAEELKAASQTSCNVLRELGPDIQWVHSYVTDDKLFCIYRAPDAEIIREHAKRGGFPADAVLKVHRVIDPVTAE
jgi:predicted Rdx family selenoprotein